MVLFTETNEMVLNFENGIEKNKRVTRVVRIWMWSVVEFLNCRNSQQNRNEIVQLNLIKIIHKVNCLNVKHSEYFGSCFKCDSIIIQMYPIIQAAQ